MASDRLIGSTYIALVAAVALMMPSTAALANGITLTTTSTSVTTTTLGALCDETPATGCRFTPPGKSQVKIKDRARDRKDRLNWRWKRGAETTLEEWKNPVEGSATYRLCVYDSSAKDQPLSEIDVPPGGVCDGDPCWTLLEDKGYKYRDKLQTPDGIEGMNLVHGLGGKAKIKVKGKGENLRTPTLAPIGLALPVTVQLLIDDGITTLCWQSVFTTVKKTSDEDFSAKGP